jgi:uncharacterized protein (TIGR01777 family)
MSTYLITGGTGMVGNRLTEMLLEKGHEVIVLTRKIPTNKATTTNISYALWDVNKQTIDAEAIAKADYIVHLAGAGVADKRWSAARKEEIKNSRTESSALIVKALTDMPNKVQAVISASAIGWYGEVAEAITEKENFQEDAKADTEFLGDTCRLWEESIQPVELIGKRLVKLRIGIVLSTKGGALAEFIKPIKMGVAAILGSGKQFISWVHIDDVCRMFIYASENQSLSGSYNAVAPKPITNKQLTIQIATLLRKQFFIPIPVPGFVLKIIMGEMSVEVLKSAYISSRKIKQAGFTFLYPAIESALGNLLSKNKQS